MLCTVGYTRTGNRQIAVWDKRQMKSWVNVKTVDLGTPGTPLLLYDRVRCARSSLVIDALSMPGINTLAVFWCRNHPFYCWAAKTLLLSSSLMCPSLAMR